jgi:HK97 gp10 family phage protein
MTVTMKFEGGRELERELERISKRTTRKSVGRRVLKKEAQPLADKMRAMAPDDPSTSGDDLAASISVSTKLSARQKKQHRKMPGKSAVEMFVGPGPDPAAWNQEFGNVNHPAQPFARPAWDADKAALLKRISDGLWREVRKAAERAERRAARQQALRGGR